MSRKRGGKEDFGAGSMALLAQLLQAMKDVAEKMDEFYKKEDVVKLNAAKKEFLSLQEKVDGLLR